MAQRYSDQVENVCIIEYKKLKFSPTKHNIKSSIGRLTLCAVLAITLYGLSMKVAVSSDNTKIISFARTNAEKFKSETTAVKDVTLGSKLTVRGVLDYIDLMPFGLRYDDAAGEAFVGYSLATLYTLKLSESCKLGRSFLGQNAFGAKKMVGRKTCERFFVADGNAMGVSISGARIKMSPAQFRTITKSGVKTEIDFTIGHPDREVAVGFDDTTHDATIDHPVQSHMKVWTVYGEIDDIRWILPGDSQEIRVWNRQP